MLVSRLELLLLSETCIFSYFSIVALHAFFCTPACRLMPHTLRADSCFTLKSLPHAVPAPPPQRAPAPPTHTCP
jgi:hypothetical protein